MSRGTDVRTGGPAQPEPWRERLARWWAHRKLRAGRCSWCDRTLPDTGSPMNDGRTCSESCAGDLWEFEQI